MCTLNITTCIDHSKLTCTVVPVHVAVSTYTVALKAFADISREELKWCMKKMVELL